jgi:GNAT superfamily N-acetyltransferase
VSDTAIRYRKARLSDSQFVRDLRNAAADRRFYRNTEYIKQEDHVKFWSLHCKDYYIIEIYGNIAGYIGFVNSDFRIAIIEKYRGNGYGKQIIKHWLEELKHKLIYVHKENKRSLRTFEANGFSRISDDGTFVCLRRE